MQSENYTIPADCLETNKYQYQFSISLKYEIIKNYEHLDLATIKIIHQAILDELLNNNLTELKDSDNIKGLIILYSTIFKYFYQHFSNHFVDFA